MAHCRVSTPSSEKTDCSPDNMSPKMYFRNAGRLPAWQKCRRVDRSERISRILQWAEKTGISDNGIRLCRGSLANCDSTRACFHPPQQFMII